MLILKTTKSFMLSGVAVAAVIMGTAVAQAQDTGTEAVVVTGSRIASPDAVAAAPLTVISATDIAQTKAATLEETISRLPSMQQTNSSNDQNSISPGGISTADMRGLGSERTLVLVDGQRMVSTFVSGAQGQDLQNIPVDLIDRVEILRDGASPIYGADAIAGVINIITKKDYEGLELGGGAGISTYGDHATKQLSALFGVQSGKGGIVAGLQYVTEDPVRQSQREWAGGGDGAQNIYAGSSAIPYGRFQGATSGTVYCGTATNTIAVAASGSCGSFNTANDPDLIQGRSIINANLQAHYDISDNLQLYSSSFFTNRKSNAILNPEPVGDVYPSAKWLNGIVIPPNCAALPAATVGCGPIAPGSTTLTPGNPSNTTGEPLLLRKRFYEGGDRVFDDNVDTFQERVGIKGKLWDAWSFDAGYQYGESDSNDYTKGAVNLTHIQELVGAVPCESGAPAGCGSALLAGPNSLTASQAAYATYDGVDNSRYEQNIAYLDITGNLPWGLPAGNIGVAAGANWRREAVKAIPDALKQTGDFAEGTTLPTQGQYSVTEFYGELNVPLLKNVPFVEDLSVDLAGRYSDYSNFGNANVYKGSFNWQVNDIVRFRGGYGTGVRAPQVGGELYLGSNQSADAFNDPCVGATPGTTVATNCRTAIGPGYNPATFTQAVPQLSAARIGNPNLRPETSNQWNLGAVFTLDSIVSGLSATIDYYNIHVNNYITLIDPGTAVSLCYGSVGFTDANCANVGARNPVNGALTSYTEPYTNLGYIRTDGVDMGLNWNSSDLLGHVGLEGWGFGFNTEWTYLNNWKQQNLDGSVTQYAGTYSEGAISYGQPKWKGNFTTTVSMPEGGPSFAVTERFIGGSYDNLIYGEDPTSPGYAVPNLLFTDININVPYENYNFNLGIDNLFDKDPPLAIDPYVQTLTNQYDFAGRTFYLKATAKF